ncbi:MAG TPA: universal stress protein [Burkholderiaceae bacterium]|nr:universal stress protein [Burkholderiaceae bacterium]
MSQLKNILVATDLSGPAQQAADRAARLARMSGSALRLVHVLGAGVAAQLQSLIGLGSELETRLVEATRQELQTLAERLAAEYAVQADAALLQGSVANEITRAADTMDADLVVLGARGKDFLRRLMLGSTAERLLRKSTRPMLVVKQRAHEPYRRVLVAVDFSAWSAPLVELARGVAPGAQIVLLSAYDVPFEGKLRYASVPDATIDLYREQAWHAAERQLHALAARTGLGPGQWTPCLPRGDPSLAIIEHELEYGCDLVVVGKHGQNMAEELLLGSVTSHVLAESAGDVLVSTATSA